MAYERLQTAPVPVQHVRDILHGVDTLKELFENVESRNIVAFIIEVQTFIIVYNVVFILA